MGEKGKGKDSGKANKKPKTPKQGRRPHELRQRDAAEKKALP